MRILQISPAFYPAISIGGPIFTTLSLHQSLYNKNHYVDVLTTPLGLTDNATRQIKFNTPIHSHMRGNIIYQPFYGYPHFTFSPQTFFWLQLNIKNYDLVILHGVWNFPLLASSLICRLNDIPYIIFPHGTLYKETIELKSSRIKKLLLKVFVNTMLSKANRIIFTTNDEQQKVSTYLKLKLSPYIMPNIVVASEFENLPLRGSFRQKYNISPDTIVLLHYGRISKKKGIEYSIQALAKLTSKYPDIILAVVGGDEENYCATIKECAKKYTVLDKILFTGLVQRIDGIEAMVDADIFVLPSLSENFGMAVVEAMLCKLPVVVSNNVGIAPDISKANAGVMVELTKENAPLINAISDLLDNPVKRIEVAIKGKQFAIDHYDDKAVSSCLDELLASIYPS